MNHPPHQHAATDNSRQTVTRRVAMVGMATNLFLAVAQIIGGIATHSQALVADAMHTLSDLVGDIVVLFAAQQAGKAADANHPYGHGRIETLATVILGLLLGGVAVVLFLQAWERLFGGVPLPTPSAWAMAFALLAIVGKETLYHYTVHIAKRIHSPMLHASAWHHRSDALSSVLVLLALAGTQVGFPWLDAVAAIIVAGMIFYMAVQLLLESTSELVDTGLDSAELDAIRSTICATPGVENLHMLRTRRMAGRVLADAHLQVNGRLSVSEGHHIGETVVRRLRQQFPSLSDIVVHIDPEDDEQQHPCAHLPSRAELLARLKDIPSTAAVWDRATDLTLHYIGGKITLDLILRDAPPAQALADFTQACQTIGCIEQVNFYQQIAPI